VGEFSSIIGLIKRAQRTYGRIFTVSGVAAMFRRSAIVQCGLWSPEMLTEDIDISWRLQTCHWDIRFEPHALCWILMPETLRGLWKQRLRWAMGGCQVIARYASVLSTWRYRRMVPLFVEYLVSVVWAYAMVATLVLFVLGLFVALPAPWQVSLLPRWHGVLLGTTCFLQIMVGMFLDRRYDAQLWRNFFWMVWYPMAYWMITTLTIFWAVPATLARGRGRRARWVSPDRGMRNASDEAP
jgi:biofilm PGA synthesis N-glycosyltransferase PgaC